MPLPSSLNYLRPICVNGLARIGRASDGGYVLPISVVRTSDCLLSFGVETDWSFEETFKNINRSVRILAFDHSIGAGKFLKQAMVDTTGFVLGKSNLKPALWRWKIFFKYILSFRTMTHLPLRVVDRKELSNDVTIDEIFGKTNNARRIFVKIDIEGFEYEVIERIMSHSERVIGLAIEFHDVEKMRDKFEHLIGLMKLRYDIVHIHGNNWEGLCSDGLPNVLELSFLMKSDSSLPVKQRCNFPIEGLDCPCKPGFPDLSIQFGND